MTSDLVRRICMNKLVRSRACFCFIAFCVAGCKTLDLPPVSDEARLASMVPFKNRRVGGQSLVNHAISRSGLLTSGANFTESDQEDSNAFESNGVFSNGGSFGAATAIDSRGYFLTAAHCVDENQEMLQLLFLRGEGMSVKRARVVFMGASSGDSFDFAILHVPETLDNAFEWSEHYVVGDPVFCAGAVMEEMDSSERDLKMDMTGGVIEGLGSQEADGQTFKVVDHSAPIYHGYSGGPLVSTDGKLVGINYSVSGFRRVVGKPVREDSSAIRPDLKWLQAIIEKDARSQSW